MQLVIVGLFVLVYALFRLPVYVHAAQGESYQLRGYLVHHNRLVWRFPDWVAWLCAVVSALQWAFTRSLWTVAVGGLVAILFAAVSFVRRRRQSFKKPLVWTARVRRLVTGYLLITVVEAVLLLWFVPGTGLVVCGLGALNLGLALILLKPVEGLIANRFKHKANARLRQLKDLHQLRVVGVTGSFGKTSTKRILADILSVRYEVLATPGSFNTPMGICRVVNEQLTPSHQVFVAEMGARHRGDIRELVKLAEPDHAMITAVGPAHLETFGSIENIAKTKFDLARGVPAHGNVVINGDNAMCVKESQTLGRPVLTYGIDSPERMDAYAKDIHVEGMDTVFTLGLRGDGEFECKTKLLGRHNVLNIVGAALLARRVGLTPEEVQRGILRIQPVEHRLQLIDPGTGALVVDDAFNANPEGAQMALDVLGQFEGYKKWIVTPGMLELGAESDTIHRQFGQQMAKVCDYVVLVGRMNSNAMNAGLKDSGFPDDRIFRAKSLAEASTVMQGSGFGPGHIVLFENDFPDYLEDEG